MAYAHSKLVVHRDPKHANMLVISASAVVLTPDHASPEQIRGENIVTAADSYSRAVVSYEVLTGTRPPVSAEAAKRGTVGGGMRKGSGISQPRKAFLFVPKHKRGTPMGSAIRCIGGPWLLLHQSGKGDAADALIAQMLAAIPPEWTTNSGD